ncbi:MAG: adenine phosphoribosyltransferase [bacterium]
MEGLKKLVRDIPDFPKKGVIFKDITTLLANGQAFKKVVDTIGERYKEKKIDAVLGIEARGFIIASALAYKLGAGLVIVRKPGKLPYKTHNTTYQLEYGTDGLEIHQDAVKTDDRVLIVDDVLATGGTITAAIDLVNKLKGEIVELAFLIELTFLNGRKKLEEYNVFSVMQY